MLRTATLMTTLLLAAGAWAADVYKYVDEQGRPIYTDRPQTLPAERLDIESGRTDPVAVQERLAREQAAREQAGVERTEARQAAADRRDAQAISEKDKAERCAAARQRYDRYMTSHRLYEDLGDGQRRYLSDAEIDAARSSAKASMEEQCK